MKNTLRNRPARKVIFAGLLVLIFAVITYAAYVNRAWNVPESAKQLANPVAPSKEALQSAHEIYSDKCADCHGDTGKGDGPDAYLHIPEPTNLANFKRMDAMSDGELFYKITHGRRPMPGFENRLTDQARWELVLLIRAFAAQNATQSGSQPPH